MNEPGLWSSRPGPFARSGRRVAAPWRWASRWVSLGATLCTLLGGWGWPGDPGQGGARASGSTDAQRAEEWYQVAMAHMKAARYLKAAKAFEEAHALDPDPVLLWNIGRAYEKAGELDKANRYYTRFLKSEGIPGELRVKANRRIVEISVALEKARLEREQALKEAKLKAELKAQLEAERQRAAKAREEAEARAQAELAKEMAARREAKLHAEQARREQAQRQAARAEAQRRATAAHQARAQALRRRALAPSRHRAVSTAGWVLLGAGVALAGAGGGLFGHAASLRGDVRDAKGGAQGGPATAMTRAQALATEDDANLQATLGAVGLAVGGAALTTGVVLLLVGDDEPPATAVSADVAQGGLLVRVGSRY